MSDHLEALSTHVEQWRQLSVQDYWVRLSYIGGDINLVGEHEVTRAEDKLWHSKDAGDWNELAKGSFKWLFSIEGTFVWTKDIITKLLPRAETGQDALELRFNDDFGYVEFMRLKMAKRDTDNVTVEVNAFGLGPHPEL